MLPLSIVKLTSSTAFWVAKYFFRFTSQIIKSFVKTLSLTWNVQKKLFILSMVEVKGISSGAVKCVDIGKNTDGEGTLLGYY